MSRSSPSERRSSANIHGQPTGTGTATATATGTASQPMARQPQREQDPQRAKQDQQ